MLTEEGAILQEKAMLVGSPTGPAEIIIREEK